MNRHAGMALLALVVAACAPAAQSERDPAQSSTNGAAHAGAEDDGPTAIVQAAPTPEPVPVCPPARFEVTRCITGGMARQTPDGLRADHSCTTECLEAPPVGNGGGPCAEIAPRRFRCDSYAP